MSEGERGAEKPPFDATEEDVAKSHEIRRESIRDGVEDVREVRADKLEGSREARADRVEDKREQRAVHVEDKREQRAVHVEDKREERAGHVEARRIVLADELEEVTVRRLRFIALCSMAAALIAIAVAIGSFVQTEKINDNGDQIKRITALQRQGLGVRSAICRSFENQHKQEVLQLRSTYAYLLSLSPAERRENLNKTVAAQVPLTEKNARSDQDDNGIFVPLYCDDPNVGLPEPDPVIPKRPASLHPPRVPAPLP